VNFLKGFSNIISSDSLELKFKIARMFHFKQKHFEIINFLKPILIFVVFFDRLKATPT